MVVVSGCTGAGPSPAIPAPESRRRAVIGTVLNLEPEPQGPPGISSPCQRDHRWRRPAMRRPPGPRAQLKQRLNNGSRPSPFKLTNQDRFTILGQRQCDSFAEAISAQRNIDNGKITRLLTWPALKNEVLDHLHLLNRATARQVMASFVLTVQAVPAAHSTPPAAAGPRAGTRPH